MFKVLAFIKAARLRTLPLSVSGIIIGAALAIRELERNSILTSIEFWLAIITTLGFQITSNFANDYGDGVKGTDANRKGETRQVASGIISAKAMKQAVIITSAITFCIAIILIYTSIKNTDIGSILFFVGLTVLAIVSAITYTIGKNAYGYFGYGDIFVFVFFGIISVFGSYYLIANNFSFTPLLPAIAVGLLSTAVLNLNNLRDYQTDIKSNKRTLIVKLGIKNGKIYHYFLIIGAAVCIISYILITYTKPLQLLYLIPFLILFKHLKTVYTTTQTFLLDSELKKVALSTFMFAVLFSLFH